LPAPPAATDAAAHLVTLSARSPAALRALAAAHRDRLATEAPPALADLAAALALHRTHHDHRLSLVAAGAPALVDHLDAFLRDEPRPGTSSGRAAASRRVVFVFPGQGAQWAGMAQGLLGEPVFRAALEACHAALAPEGVAILPALAAPALPTRLGEIQPLLFAVQVALAALWRSWGIEPAAVVGHSMGEVAAAHVAGALDLADAARLIARRSRLLERVSGLGAMLAVELAPHEAEALLEGLHDRVSIAAENGPASTVLSGDAAALDALAARLLPRAVHCRRIQVDVASHSPFMDGLRADLLEALADLRPRRAEVPLISTVTGAALAGPELTADYWYRNLRQPVRFWPAVERLAAEGHAAFLELSPHPILLPALEQGLRGAARPALLPSLRRREDERATLLGSLGALHTLGLAVRWEALHPAPARPVALPSYPWQRQRFWLAPRPPAQPSGPPRRHPLLGPHVAPALASGTHLWEGDVDTARLPFLRDHRVDDAVLLPGTACLEMALAAAAEALGAGPHALADVVFEAAVFLPEGGARTLQLTLTAAGPGAAFSLHGRAAPGDPWVLHARGRVLSGPTPAEGAPLDGDAVLARCGEPAPGRDFYAARAALGNTWGPAFQGIVHLAARPGEALAEVVAPPGIAADLATYGFHPALLDACGQALVAAGAAPGAFVLAGLERVVVQRRPEGPLSCHLVTRAPEPGLLTGDVRIVDARGLPVADLVGLRLRLLDGAAPRVRGERLDDAVHEVAWAPVPLGPAGAPRPLLLLADPGPLAERLVALAREQGRACALAGPDLLDLAGQLASLASGAAVVHLLGLDAPATEPAAQHLAASALHVAQALGRADGAPRLWLVTRGAQAVTPGRVALAAAPLWGLGRSLAAEHPARFGGLVDLDPAGPPDAAARHLLAVLDAAPRGPVELALRGGLALAPHLAPRPPGPPTAPLRLAPDRTYLITGGLGELGLLVADRLVDRGARHLILLGRTALPHRATWRSLAADAPSAAAVRAVRALEARGAGVHLGAVDVGDEAALQAFLAAFAAEARPPIRGVVHAAGVQSPGALDALDRAGLAADFRAKVAGSLHLDALLPDLDFFVLFASAAALIPSPFLAAYAAANAFLGALAHDRRARGLPALAVAWGFWAGGGMVDRYRAGAERRVIPRGLESFTPAAGLDALERLLAGDAVEAAVVPADWAEFARLHPEAAASPLLAALAGPPLDAPSAPPALALPTRAAFLAAAAPERRILLQRYLRERVARTLRLAPERLPLDEPLASLGLDSLMAIELKNRIEADLGLLVPILRILECAGVEQLVDPVLGAAPPPEDDDWETLSL
jgi:myxalamid-type polyketide synthase MxaE and MxaD